MRVGGPGICGGTSPAPPAGSQFGGARTRITRSCIPCLLLRGKVTRLIVASSESRSFEEAPQLASHSCFADCFVWPRAEAIGIIVDESMRRRRHVVKSARGAYVTGRGSGRTGRCTCASDAHGPRRQQLMRRHRRAWQPSSTRSHGCREHRVGRRLSGLSLWLLGSLPMGFRLLVRRHIVRSPHLKISSRRLHGWI